MILYYNVNAISFSIQANKKLAILIKQQIYPSAIISEKTIETEINYLVKNSNGYFEIYENKLRLYKCKRLEYLVSKLEWYITGKILRELNGFLQIHAAGIVKNNKATLVIGDHGIGKTIILTYFLLKGYRCLSDDIILLNPKDLSAHCFARGFKINKDTYRILPKLKQEFLEKTINKNWDFRINAKDIRKNAFTKKAKIEKIIFVKKNHEKKQIIYKIGQSEAFIDLLLNSLNYKEHEKYGINILADLIDNSQAYCLKRVGFLSMIKQIEAIL
ncbi:MAG: hypothetical protein ABIA04_00755 [Pseudomonadota bacterium]